MSPESLPDQETSLPENFEDTLDNFNFLKKEGSPLYAFHLTWIKDMAKGVTSDEVLRTRNKSYSGWTDDNFKKLLEKLGEK